MNRQASFDRREVMKAAIMLVGGSLAAGSLPAMAQVAQSPRYFGPASFALLDAVCETIIPQTDTPGASAAGVPAFIDSMMSDWASPATQRAFAGALAAIDRKARDEAGAAFAELDAQARTALLTQHDNRRDADWRRLRELTLMGYYLSEAGATQELRYELVPGAWEADIPVTPETRAWAV